MEIDHALPGLQWEELAEKKGSRIAAYFYRADGIEDLSLSADQLTWVVETLEDFYRVFQPLIDSHSPNS